MRVLQIASRKTQLVRTLKGERGEVGPVGEYGFGFATITAGFTIPATTTPVAVSVSPNFFVADNTSLVGNINGIDGTIARVGSSYTFTRSTAGSSTSVAANSQFTPILSNRITQRIDSVSALSSLPVTGIPVGTRYRPNGYHAGVPTDMPTYELQAIAGRTVNGGTLLASSNPAFIWVSQVVDRVNVRWFGARGDGVTDDTAAIRAAIRGVVALSSFVSERDPVGSIFFPSGVYRITQNGVFSDYAAFKRQGVLCTGSGPGNSIIWLDPSALAGDTWFYDNGATSRGWGMSFRDMGFHGGISWRHALTYSNFDSRCKGFKLSGPGWECSASFINCTFAWLDIILQCSGSNNADTHIFTDCEFLKCHDIVVLDNPQSFNVQLESCYGSLIWGDIARWTANANGGAGNFRINGGAWIMIPDEWGGAPCMIINCAAGGPAAGNGNVGVRDARFELRGNGSSIGDFTEGYPMFLFENCSFLKSVATAPTTWAITNIYKSVVFRDCAIVPPVGQWPIFVVNGTARFGKNGTYLFDNCFLSGWDNWTLTFTNNFGQIITRNCFSALTDTVGDPGIREVNGEVRGTESVSTTGRARQLYIVNPFKGNTLPVGNGTNESTISLPRGATLVRVTIRLLPSTPGATGSTYRLLVGSNDKSIVYAQTTGAAQNAGFTLESSVYVKLGTAIADRTVRIWADNGSGGSITAGSPSPVYAALEYV